MTTPRACRTPAMVLAASLPLIAVPSAVADIKSWNVGDGFWNTPVNWSPIGAFGNQPVSFVPGKAYVWSVGYPANGVVIKVADIVSCPADFDGDGKVDGADLGILLCEWGVCGGCLADITLDGVVDGADLGYLLSNWGPCLSGWLGVLAGLVAPNSKEYVRRMVAIITAQSTVSMAYVHELPGWPRLSWDEGSLARALAAVRHRQGRLLGRMESPGFEPTRQASLAVLAEDVVTTSAIGGEIINPDDARSSIARQLGLEVAGIAPSTRDADGMVEVLLDATLNFEAPLTAERLFGWHAALFPNGRSGLRHIAVAAWRPPKAGPMRVVWGPIGREKEHFEAPDAHRLDSEIATFLDWFNRPASIDPVMKAGVAHFWFVTVHPFEDGNGRIARALADIAMTRADGRADRCYSMSSQIAADRKEYYLRLESAQRGSLDVTPWLVWFLDCLDRSLDAAERSLAEVFRRSRIWEQINRQPINARQRIVRTRLLGPFEGFLTTSKYAALAKCSTDAALRDITELLARRVLIRNDSRGRSTSYRLAEPREDDSP